MMKYVLCLLLISSLSLPALAEEVTQETKETPVDTTTIEDPVEDLFQVAQIYAQQKMYDKAIEAFYEVLKLDKKHEKSYVGLAIVYSQQKKYKEALKELDTVMKLFPKAYIPHKVQGMIYRDLKKNKEAAAAFELYLKKAPPKKIKDKKELEALIEQLKKAG